MSGLGNPSITSPRQGDRNGRQNRGPRDLTGREYQRLHAEQDAKRAAEKIDISEVRKAEYLRGHSDGYSKGLDDGWDACIAALVEMGVLDPDEPAEDE